MTKMNFKRDMLVHVLLSFNTFHEYVYKYFHFSFDKKKMNKYKYHLMKANFASFFFVQ